MIRPDARLTIQEIPLECLQVKEHQIRHIEKVEGYYHLMLKHSDAYPGLIAVVPSDTHKGMYCVLDGHHRFCSYILTGRDHALCLIVEEGSKC